MNDTLMNVYTNLNKQCLSLSFVTLLRDLQDLYEGRDVQCPFEQGDTETDTDLQQQEQWRSAPLNLRWAQPANFHELLKSVSLPQEDLLETFGSIHQALEEMEIEMQEAFINAVDDTFHLDINDAKCGQYSPAPTGGEVVKALSQVHSIIETCVVDEHIRRLDQEASRLEEELQHSLNDRSKAVEQKEASRSQWLELKKNLNLI
eukprot:Lankesteria_metandrocarpae@DN4673_c0_g1_i3.p1